MCELSSQTILKQLIDVIAKYSMDEQACRKGSMASHILNDLRVNSARLIDVVLEIEDVFNISVTDEEMDKMITAGDAIDLIQQKKASAE
jgi:acyl carrier protein